MARLQEHSSRLLHVITVINLGVVCAYYLSLIVFSQYHTLPTKVYLKLKKYILRWLFAGSRSWMSMIEEYIISLLWQVNYIIDPLAYIFLDSAVRKALKGKICPKSCLNRV